MAPRLVLDEVVLSEFGTGTATVGVMTVVDVLETTITEPPGRVDDDSMTESEVVAGNVDILEEDALVSDDEDDGGVVEGAEDGPLLLIELLSEQEVVKSVAVAEVDVIGMVMTT